MSKFLRLVEENRPAKDEYTVELRDVNGKIVDSFTLTGVSSPIEIFGSFKEEWVPKIPAEDYEIKSGEAGYNVDKEVAKMAQRAKSGVAGMAGKVLGTKAQKAKKLMKDRENIVVKAFALFDQDTKNLKQAVQDAAKSPTTS